MGLIPGWADPLEENGNTLQYARLGNHMDRTTWWSTVYRVMKNRTTTEMTEHIHMQASAYIWYEMQQKTLILLHIVFVSLQSRSSMMAQL